MITMLWRILLALSLLSLGLVLGATTGAQLFVTRADGLAGGAMVLWYGILGALVLLVIGIILGLKLQGTLLLLAALIFTVLAAILYGMATFKSMAMTKAELGSDSAYEAAGQFTVTMERLDTSDPYLFVKMEINSRKRTWTQTGPAPDHEVFYAHIKAKTLVEIRVALNKVAAINTEELADCHSDQGPANKRLRWDLMDAQIPQNGQGLVKKGVVNINAACLREHFEIVRALSLVEKASQGPVGTVKRK